MNKRIFVMFAVCLLLSPFLNLISAQSFGGLGGEFGGAGTSNIFGINPESGVKLTQKWEYLGTEWKNILMQNAIIKGVDSFLQKLNSVFLVLFGTPYSLSVALFLTVLLWVFLFFLVFNILGNTIFSKWVAVVISLGVAVGAAQIKLFQMPVNLIIGLFFGEKPWWVKLLIGLGIVVIIVLAFVVEKKFGALLAASKKKTEEEKHRIKLATGAKVGEQLYKAAGK